MHAESSHVAPLHIRKEWRRVDELSMDVEAALTDQGQLLVRVTTTWRNLDAGATGGALVLALNANRAVIYRWLIWPLHFGCRRRRFGRSRRTDNYVADVGQTVLAGASALQLWLSDMTKDRWGAVLAEATTPAAVAGFVTADRELSRTADPERAGARRDHALPLNEAAFLVFPHG